MENKIKLSMCYFECLALSMMPLNKFMFRAGLFGTVFENSFSVFLFCENKKTVWKLFA